MLSIRKTFMLTLPLLFALTAEAFPVTWYLQGVTLRTDRRPADILRSTPMLDRAEHTRISVSQAALAPWGPEITLRSLIRVPHQTKLVLSPL